MKTTPKPKPKNRYFLKKINDTYVALNELQYEKFLIYGKL